MVALWTANHKLLPQLDTIVRDLATIHITVAIAWELTVHIALAMDGHYVLGFRSARQRMALRAQLADGYDPAGSGSAHRIVHERSGGRYVVI